MKKQTYKRSIETIRLRPLFSTIFNRRRAAIVLSLAMLCCMFPTGTMTAFAENRTSPVEIKEWVGPMIERRLCEDIANVTLQYGGNLKITVLPSEVGYDDQYPDFSIYSSIFAIQPDNDVTIVAQTDRENGGDKNPLYSRGVISRSDTHKVGPIFRVHNGAKLTLKNLTLDGNKDGNKVNTSPLIEVQRGGELVLENCALINNNGGGLYNAGSVTMNECLMANNNAKEGGGIINKNDYDNTPVQCKISNSLITNNQASQDGGGIYNYQGTKCTMVNSTVSDNSALGFGGGMYNQVDVPSILENSSIINNTATRDGGGIYVVPGTPYSHNISDFPDSSLNVSGSTSIVNNFKETVISGGVVSGGMTSNFRLPYIEESPTSTEDLRTAPGLSGYLPVRVTGPFTGTIGLTMEEHANAPKSAVAVISTKPEYLSQNSAVGFFLDRGVKKSDGKYYDAVYNSGKVKIQDVSAAVVPVTSSFQLARAIYWKSTYIDICADIPITGDPVVISYKKNVKLFSSNGSRLLRTSDCQAPLVSSTFSETKLTLENITIDGQNIPSKSAAVSAIIGGKLVINPGTVILNNLHSVANAPSDPIGYSGGGVYNEGSLIMNGGTITNNSVKVDGKPEKNRGGGVYNDGVFVLNGGSISNNTSEMGGGIYNHTSCKLTINGAQLSGNAAHSGAGVYNAGVMNINGASIRNNKSISDGAVASLSPGSFRVSGSVYIMDNYRDAAQGEDTIFPTVACNARTGNNLMVITSHLYGKLGYDPDDINSNREIAQYETRKRPSRDDCAVFVAESYSCAYEISKDAILLKHTAPTIHITTPKAVYPGKNLGSEPSCTVENRDFTVLRHPTTGLLLGNWEIKKPGGQYQKFDPYTTVLDASYVGATIRYALDYIYEYDQNKMPVFKTAYSNEVWANLLPPLPAEAYKTIYSWKNYFSVSGRLTDDATIDAALNTYEDIWAYEEPLLHSYYRADLRNSNVNEQFIGACQFKLLSGSYDGDITASYNNAKKYDGKTIIVRYWNRYENKMEKQQVVCENGVISFAAKEITTYLLTAVVTDDPFQTIYSQNSIFSVSGRITGDAKLEVDYSLFKDYWAYRFPALYAAYTKDLRNSGTVEEFIYACKFELLGGSYDGELTINCNMKSEYNGKTITVRYLKQDGSMEKLKVLCENNKISFQVNELTSYLMTLEEENKSITKPVNVASPPSDNSSSSDMMMGGNTEEPSDSSDLPYVDDSEYPSDVQAGGVFEMYLLGINLWWWIGGVSLIILSLASAVVVLSFKLHKAKKASALLMSTKNSHAQDRKPME